jgi:hypothetical protein
VTITAKQLTASLTGSVTKQYDGNDTATLTAANYNLSGGVILGDTVNLTNFTSGNYDNRNVAGSPTKLVTVTGLGLDNANYSLTSSTVSANIGTITPAPITVAGATNVDKVYDTTTALPVGATGFTYAGVLAGDTVSVTAAAVSSTVVVAVVNATLPAASTLNVIAPDVPPPGPGVKTVTAAVPAAARSLARMSAVSVVASTNVVARGEPFQRTTEDWTKFAPVAVSVNPGPPAMECVASRPVRTGAGLRTACASRTSNQSVSPSLLAPAGVAKSALPLFGSEPVIGLDVPFVGSNQCAVVEPASVAMDLPASVMPANV